MSRPLYESSQDAQNEKRVAHAIGVATESTMKKTPKAYPIDWCAYKGQRIKAWVEIKCRKIPSSQHETLLISCNKIVHGKHLAETFGCMFLLVVQWTDGIYWWKCPNDVTGYRVDNGGRVDRNDAQDMEPVLHIPITEFTKLKG